MAAPLKVYPNVAGLRYPDELSGAVFSPSGITVHHTADPDVERTVRDLREQRLGYHLIVDRDGKVWQTAWLNRQVAHAGNARWRGRSPNRAHLAVAIACWGRLTEGGDGQMRSWSGAVVPRGEVAIRKDAWSKQARWQEATSQQEAACLEVLRFLCRAAAISPADICGHDECALPEGRKDDPGGTLSRGMIELRTMLALEQR